MWVSRYADYLYSYALRRLNDEERARDLMHETFLAALERTDDFRGDNSERTWLTAILKYKVIDVYRKQSRTAGTVSDGTEFLDLKRITGKKNTGPSLSGWKNMTLCTTKS